MHDPLLTPDHLLSWDSIFNLWRDGESRRDDWKLAKRIAPDFPEISGARTVRWWLSRGAIPMERWERLIIVLEKRWGLIVSERQLVRATLAARAKQKDAA